MTTEWLLLGLVIVLLAASAYFVAAEFALIAARRTIIEPLAVNSSRARTTLKAMENVSEMMACAQLGITLCGVLLGALGEPAVAALLEPVFHSLGVPEGWLLIHHGVTGRLSVAPRSTNHSANHATWPSSHSGGFTMGRRGTRAGSS